jgi:hypothetical protein
MKKAILIVLTAFWVLTGCGIQKRTQTGDKTKTTTQIDRETISRPSDKVVSETKYNIKYKDTTIVTTSYDTRTILREIYDSQGNRRAECIPEEFMVQIEKIREEIKNDIKTDRETKHEFDLTPLIWSIAGLAGILVVGLLVIGIYMSRIQKNAPQMTANIVREIMK